MQRGRRSHCPLDLAAQVEKELKDICSDILSVLEKHLIPSATSGESKVFYYKMKGDYHRYLAEFAQGNDKKEAAENSLMAYKAASDIAMTELPPTHPIRSDSIILISVLTMADCASLLFQTGIGVKLFGILLRNPQLARPGVPVS